MTFSPAYDRAVAEATAHHETSKTYSGNLFQPHAGYIKGLISRLKIATILDLGCGKGKQYEWVSPGDDDSGVPAGQTIEQFWGIKVAKHDPAWAPYAAEPEGRFDLVIQTHVMGCIPLEDVPAYKLRLYRFALKAVYLAEKLAPPKKVIYSQPETLARFFTHEEYADLMAPRGRHGLEVWLATSTPPDKTITRTQLRCR